MAQETAAGPFNEVYFCGMGLTQMVVLGPCSVMPPLQEFGRAAQQIKVALNVNNSDMNFCDWDGKIFITYS